MAQPTPIITLAAKQARLNRLTNGREPIVVVGDTTSADATLSSLASLAGVAIGAAVTGAGIPDDTTVLQLQDTAHTAELSANATASAADVSFTFTNPAYPGPLKFRIGKEPRVLDDAVTRAELAAEECDLADYPSGGYPLTFTPGYITEERVPSNESQMIQLIIADDDPTNTLYYWWIDDGTTVIMCASFELPIPMARVGAAFKAMIEDSYPPGLPISVIVPAA